MISVSVQGVRRLEQDLEHSAIESRLLAVGLGSGMVVHLACLPPMLFTYRAAVGAEERLSVTGTRTYGHRVGTLARDALLTQT